MEGDITTRGGSGDTTFDLDQQGVLEPITVPFFPQIEVGGPYATTLSWLSFVGGLATMALVIFWIYLILRAVWMQLRDAEKVEARVESANKIKSMLTGVTIALVFPVVLTVIGIALGLGPIWKWPEGFRGCVEGADNEFYFQAALRNETIDQAESECFGGSGSSDSSTSNGSGSGSSTGSNISIPSINAAITQQDINFSGTQGQITLSDGVHTWITVGEYRAIVLGNNSFALVAGGHAQSKITLEELQALQ